MTNPTPSPDTINEWWGRLRASRVRWHRGALEMCVWLAAVWWMLIFFAIVADQLVACAAAVLGNIVVWCLGNHLQSDLKRWLGEAQCPS